MKRRLFNFWTITHGSSKIRNNGSPLLTIKHLDNYHSLQSLYTHDKKKTKVLIRTQCKDNVVSDSQVLSKDLEINSLRKPKL